MLPAPGPLWTLYHVILVIWNAHIHVLDSSRPSTGGVSGWVAWPKPSKTCEGS